MSDKTETTSVQQVEVNMDELLGTGADAVMLADEPKKEGNRNIFSDASPDMTFLDKAPESATEEKTEETPEASKDSETVESVTPKKLPTDEVFVQPGEEIEEDIEQKSKGGRPTSLVQATKKMIEKKLLLPFDDDKKVEDYTAEDFEELIAANFDQMKEKYNQEVPAHFFQGLPEEMQQAYDYISNGGQDLKGLFQALAATNEIRELDITNDMGQKYAIRTYLQATNYGTPEEIEDEVFSIEDRGELAKKAKQFKPKLDAMQDNIVQRRLADQEQQQKQRENQSQVYMDSVYTSLEKGDLNGIGIDNRTQNLLYAGLVQSNYPSVSGKQTNLLGHLLEKYQWVEPNHGLIAEALWLLADPDGYRGEVRKIAKKEGAVETMRKLKTEQSAKSTGGSYIGPEDEETPTRGNRQSIRRPKRNFFERK